MCDQVAPIFQAIEFVESHLQEDINVAQIADAAGYSLFHFMRKFNQMVHHTPYDYLMRRRLTEAAEQLIQSNRRIIDIAQDFCFNDQETFSRVFRKMFQMTPSQCRKANGVPLHYLMQARTIEELNFINSDHFVTPLIVETNEVQLIGLMTLLDETEKIRCKQRERICADLLTESKFQPQALIYELELSLNPLDNRFYYFVGIEAPFFSKVSPVLVRQNICEGRFVKMEVPESELALAIKYIQSTWIPRNGLLINNKMKILCWQAEDNKMVRSKTLLLPIE